MLEGETGKFVAPMQVRLLLHRDGSKDVSSAIMDKAESVADDQRQTQKGLPAVCFSGKQVDPRNTHLYHKTTERELYVEERQLALEKDCFEGLLAKDVMWATRYAAWSRSGLRIADA